ncbi:hypothetical protein [Archangium lansingense]|uniref:Uncharacterized protein n=1 Tax=Archangium lansingense TaxID=2995310 RepID=A0ABT3ZXW5_9BACT|nr:hypothetical protein [Archangium lansinium]MCY1073864.1 hypothetical protein [Archangium lansinium]
MLSKNQTEVLEEPKPEASTDMLLSQDGVQKSLNPAPTAMAMAGNGGMNDPPVGT